MADGLTPKQRLFALEYLVDLNATQAAIRAGYSEESARAIGSENLTKPDIRAFIDAALAKREAKLELRADRVLLELMRVAMIDPGTMLDADGKLLPLKQMPEDVRRAICSVEIEEDCLAPGGELDDGAPRPKMVIARTAKLRMWSKVDALIALAKHLKLFTDRVEHSGPGGAPLGLDVVFVAAPKKESGGG